MYTILIVEDDRTIAELLKKHLSAWGYRVSCVRDFSRVLEEFGSVNPQLVLLDIGLPFFNGFHWCQKIREISSVPVVFLSSAGDNMNIVMAMNMGGDDFIEKPFDLHVLTAKIQAILRRSYSLQGQSPLIEHRGVILHTGEATVTFQNQKISLSRNEYRILQVLMERAGNIVPRDDLMTALWESDSFVDDNTLTVNVNRLRKKLADAGLADFIQTKKGLGYQIV
ncbi:MAG TPA: response regulator transcription factor [Candidatus Bariatricus faecipullorum]|nr:response regulator transcription factor [Candidatus Bariatricus faecipullorum]